MIKKIQPFFWLALLAHLLLFLSFSITYLFEPDVQAFEKKSDNYLPAYLQQQQNKNEQQEKMMEPQAAKEAPVEQPKNSDQALAIKKQEAVKDSPKEKDAIQKPSKPQSKSQSTAAFMEAESPNQGKPLDEPLMKELSRATAAKLYYPRNAAVFHITGTVTIGFLLYPDGRVTEITLLKSSGFRILDEAALNTIRSISPVRDANLYLNSPKTMVAGIIFG